MKQIFFFATLLFLINTLPSCAQAPNHSKSELTWYTDLAEAQKLSNKTNKPIFGFFTGSDWCGWCHKLHNDVFRKKEFIEWAKKNVILLELDYPRRKELPPALKQQNSELQQVFKVQGYPTCWMFFVTDDPTTKKRNINPLGSQGYPQGAEPGKEQIQFLKQANEILKSKK